SGDDVISFNSTYTITMSTAGNISMITNIEIDGPVTLDGNNTTNIFTMGGTANIVLDNITFQNGDTNGPGNGGAILANSTNVFLTVNNSVFDGNHADSSGGAISSDGQLDISDTIFQNNTAGYDGGAIYQSASSPMTIQASGFLDNSA